MLTSYCLTTSDEFERLREEWTKLFEVSELKTTFLTWEWLFTWWELFGTGCELRLYTVWRGEQLAGVAPLMLAHKRKWGVKLSVLTQIGYQDADISGFIVAKGDEEAFFALCQAIRQHAAQWQLLEMIEVPFEQAGYLQDDRFLPASKYRVRAESNPHLSIPITSDWEAFFASQSKNLRHNYKKKLTFLEREGKRIDFRRYSGDEVTKGHLEEVFRINRHGSFPNAYRAPIQKELHYRLLERLHGHAGMDISFLELDGTPVAFRYGFLIDGRYEDWRMGFDTGAAAYSPGTILFLYLIRDNFQKGSRLIDLLRGHEEHKKRWTVEEKPYLHVYFFRRRDLLTNLLVNWLPKLKNSIVKFYRGYQNTGGEKGR